MNFMEQVRYCARRRMVDANIYENKGNDQIVPDIETFI